MQNRKPARSERVFSFSSLLTLLLTLLAPRASTPVRADDAASQKPEQGVEPAKPAVKEPAIPIRFQGLLPGNANPELEGKFRIEFRIYQAPQGGQPIWREEHDVRAVKGQIAVQLGLKTPIPMSIHEATYKWLGAAVNGQREVFPRYPIVNVVYASLQSTLLAHEKWQAEENTRSKDAVYKPQGAKAISPEAAGLNDTDLKETEPARNWREALESARSKGRDLPDYTTWYQKLESLPPEKSASWTGHYEWVLPWVYDTASHGRYNMLFRGRFQGCDYSDLSPEKKYVYRVVQRPAEIEPEKQK